MEGRVQVPFFFAPRLSGAGLLLPHGCSPGTKFNSNREKINAHWRYNLLILTVNVVGRMEDSEVKGLRQRLTYAIMEK